MDLAGRVECFFLDPIRIPRSELKGKLILDAGCGNGSQSVAYTELGCEVVAVDLSSGLERGQKFRRRHKNASPDKVHFVQADLRHPPFARSTFDVIHSAGVLHHTPNTRHTFTQLAPLLKPNGTFYVWLYKHEAYITPLRERHPPAHDVHSRRSIRSHCEPHGPPVPRFLLRRRCARDSRLYESQPA